MLKEFVEKIVSLKENKIYEIGEKVYSDSKLELIEPPRYSPAKVEVSSLSAIVQLIKNEYAKLNTHLFVSITGFDQVRVFTTYEEDRGCRDMLYVANCDVPAFKEGWRDYEKAIIELKSKFVQTADLNELVGLMSNITDKESVETTDNGMAQSVQVRKGIALNEKVAVKPRVMLTPFRTFLEIEQPGSEFLVRLRDGGEVGIFEADGGFWKLEAKRSIALYLRKELHNFTEVTIMI